MTDSNLISFEQIKRVLPHRYPFLLVDRVLSVSQDRITALKNVTANEPFFTGHFPEMAVMPGVLQIEAMAQAAGLILALSKEFDAHKEIAYLAGVDEAKFKRPVTPGDQLILEGTVLGRKKSVLKVAATASVEGQIASQATIVLIMKPLVS